MIAFIRAVARWVLRVPEVRVVNNDTAVLRALVTENMELRRLLDLPLVSSIRLPAGGSSRVTHDLPARVWESRNN